MNLISPKVEFIPEVNDFNEHIAKCARVCYGKEGKVNNAKNFVEGLIKNGHTSMLRHASRYYRLQSPYYLSTEERIALYKVWNTEASTEDISLFSSNLQEVYDHPEIYGEINEISRDEVLKLSQENPDLFECFRMTFIIDTQISTSRELNRKSPNNIAERSTRYCSSKDGITICKPWWWNEGSAEKKALYLHTWDAAEESYLTLLNMKEKPEDAREVLPLSTATRVIYTYNVKEWKHMLGLRLYDKTGKAHPNCKIVMAMVRDQINEFTKNNHIDYVL